MKEAGIRVEARLRTQPRLVGTTARWIAGAALLGFASSALLASMLGLPRDAFVGFHAAIVAGFGVAFLRIERIDPRVQLRRRWLSGLIVGALAGALLARTVLLQPASPRPEGARLAWALLWDGGLYGIVDVLLLSVVPVLAVYGSRPADELRNPDARWRWGLAALLASLCITAAYHVGFTEFRGSALAAPLIGNGIVTLSYLASGSPVAPLLSHVIMHATAVLHGMATTAQLPPH
jgi:hypothetical protein